MELVGACQSVKTRVCAGLMLCALEQVDVPDEGPTLFMPCYMPQSTALGLKVVSVRAQNFARGLPGVPSVVLLFNDATGMPLALLDGTYLTALRTAAGSAAATRLLAAADATQLVVFGAGNQVCDSPRRVALRALVAAARHSFRRVCCCHMRGSLSHGVLLLTRAAVPACRRVVSAGPTARGGDACRATVADVRHHREPERRPCARPHRRAGAHGFGGDSAAVAVSFAVRLAGGAGRCCNRR